MKLGNYEYTIGHSFFADGLCLTIVRDYGCGIYFQTVPVSFFVLEATVVFVGTFVTTVAYLNGWLLG